MRYCCRWALVLLLSACASMHSATPLRIGPFAAFEGRLIAVTPSQRWQASLHWRAPSPEHGALRLLHAASGFVLEAEWDKPRLRLRDSRYPVWREVTVEALRRHGLLLPPWTIAALLQGRLPHGFHRVRGDVWQGRIDDALVRMDWRAKQRRLELTDITHGRRLVVLIEP
ncbi:MAG: hypothetical protein D6678_00255 [Zetaproteobacteria bacterium]|nr:MAG: hypothetical protein D6678_00255 [Zetaproteobacteria bacterium]